MSVFSENLKELREQKQLSMRALAEKIQVSDAAICKWENGENEPKATYLKRLCEFFEVSADFFLGLENTSGIKIYSAPIIEEIPPLNKDAQRLLKFFNQLPYTWKMRVQAYTEAALDLYTQEKQKKQNKIF